MKQVVRKVWILEIIPNVKVTSYDKNIVNIDLSILKILQDQLRRIWVYVNQEENWFLIEKGNTEHIPMIKNVILQRKVKEWNININICNHLRGFRRT